MKMVISVLLALGALNAFAGGGSSAGLPNPAAKFCVEVAHGKLQVLSTQIGEAGYCVLGRAMIDEWTLYRYSGLRTRQTAVLEFLRSTRDAIGVARGGGSSAGLPNPASGNCIHVGGQVVIAEDTTGNQYGICEFADRSAIEEWTLFRSPIDSTNEALNAFLHR